MVKTDLTEEEKKLIIEALNSRTEPLPELMTKLFPGLAEKTENLILFSEPTSKGHKREVEQR